MTDPTSESTSVKQPKSRRGFAVMTPEQRSAISRKGGIAAHAAGSAHRFTPEEARAAGKRGGVASQRSRREAARGEQADGAT